MLRSSRPRSRFFALAALLSTLLSVGVTPWVPGLVQGQPTPAARPNPALAGTWELDEPVQATERRINEAVEPALSRLRPQLQRLARARIAETTWVPRTIEITATNARIAIRFQGEEDRTFDSAPGARENVYSRSGVRAELVQSYRPDGAIQQRFHALDGTQTNTLSPDGQHLRLATDMASPRFSRPIRFQVQYRRPGRTRQDHAPPRR